MPYAPHARDDRRDGGVAEREPDGRLREPLEADPEVRRDLPDAFEDGAPAIAPEVIVAEVVLGECRFGRDLSRQSALVERDAGDHADVLRAAEREEPVLGAL